MELRKPLIILFLLVVLSTLHLAIYTRNINEKYQVEDMKRELIDLKKSLRELDATAAKKKNLDRIESFAVNKLKMVRPEKIEYVISPTTELSP